MAFLSVVETSVCCFELLHECTGVQKQNCARYGRFASRIAMMLFRFRIFNLTLPAYFSRVLENILALVTLLELWRVRLLLKYHIP